MDRNDSSLKSQPENIKRNLEREGRLHNLSQAIHSIKNLDEILLDLQKPLQEIFEAESAAVYVIDPGGNEIYSKFKMGDSLREIRFSMDPSSIAGFAAREKRLINIINVNDPDELNKYHPGLRFNDARDAQTQTRTVSLLTLPLLHESGLMGVLQLINKKNKDGFNGWDENNAFILTETLAQAIKNLGNTIEPVSSPYSFLIQNGFLTPDELAKTRAQSNKTGKEIEDLLINDLYLSPLHVGKSLESFFNVPYVGYDESLVLPRAKDLGLEIDSLRGQNWVPLKYDETEVIVLIDDPSDPIRIEKIGKMFPEKEIQVRVGLKRDIKNYINSFFEVERVPQSQETEIPSTETKIPDETDHLDALVEPESSEPTFHAAAETTPTAESLFEEIISIAIKQGVSDIHIEPGMEGRNILVRLRKEGAIRVFEEIPATFQKDIVAHIKKLAHLDLSITKLPQKGKLEKIHGPNRFELQVVVFPTIGDIEDTMIRVVRVGKPVPCYNPVDQLGFSEPNLDKILTRLHTPKGLVLVVGPPGAGKTTSLHSFIGHINTPDKKILAAEDPVEIVQQGMRQIQIDNEVGLNYACALETFMIGNPDVILAGEITDAKAFELCLEAAGQHLVFSALNANSALDAVRQMREMDLDQARLAEVMVLIVAQKLVPSLCPHCKEDTHPSREEFDTLVKFYSEKYFYELGIEYSENLRLKKAVGCKQCIFSGYSEGIPLSEVLERSPALTPLIANKAPMEEIRYQVIKDGMMTLNQDGIYKVLKGDCDFKKIQAAFFPGVEG
ncbi:MAG: ATPase, T2SS/T4P/T4SS family [Nitrospinaceae bacterium]